MKKNKWLLFVVLYICGLVVSFNQFKVPPIIPELAAQFNADIPTISLLMSAFSLMGIVLALPSGIIVAKTGVKKLGAFVLICLAVGSALGAVAGGNFTILMTGRIVEGLANALFLMIGIILINLWFEPGKVGLPTGIFTTFVGVGQLVMFNIGKSIELQFGWGFLWWGGAVLAVLAILLWVFVIEVPQIEPPPLPEGVKPPSILSAFGNGKAWLLAVAQGCTAFLLFAFLTLYPVIFEQFYHIPGPEANGLSSLAGFFSLPVCIVSGLLVQVTGKPAVINTTSFVGLVATCSLTFVLGDATFAYIAHVFAVSLFTGMTITAVMAVAPSVARTPLHIGPTIAMVNFVYFIGVTAGAPVVSSAGIPEWTGALVPLVAASVLGLVACIVFQLASRKKQQA
jgi:predicted MFS family arabinose efflux permease